MDETATYEPEVSGWKQALKSLKRAIKASLEARAERKWLEADAERTHQYKVWKRELEIADSMRTAAAEGGVETDQGKDALWKAARSDQIASNAYKRFVVLQKRCMRYQAGFDSSKHQKAGFLA